MKLWRCEICGDPYLGENKPSNCPYCGAPARFVSEQNIFCNNTGQIEGLTEISKRNLHSTIDLEVNATKTYLCASRCSSNDENKNMFKALAKHEAEHVSLVAKALGVAKPSTGIDDNCTCKKNDTDNYVLTASLEEHASKQYGKFLSEATDIRLLAIFTALIDVETDHLKLANQKLNP